MSAATITEQASRIEPGDHMVILYEDERDVTEYLVAYIRASLARGERCIYITGDANTCAVLNRLQESAGFDVIHSGQLVVLDRRDAYSQQDKFDPDRMIELIGEFLEQALDDGYSGLSITGEISWVLDYADGNDLIIEYEWKLNERVFNQYPVSALCRYNLTRFSDEMIMNIIQLHPFVIWNQQIHENPFHIPVEGYRDNKVSQYQIKTWLENIHRFTNEKSRFHQVIAAKEAEMKELHSRMTDGIIQGMLELLAIHDTYTNNHSTNVAETAQTLAEHIGLSAELQTKVYYAALVHDIGKTLIPKEVLNKVERLEPEEMATIRLHPTHGAVALSQVSGLEEIAEAVRSHHERWDGGGYPQGLVGNQIPLLARILAVADAYEAMVSDRPYRKALAPEVASAELRRCAGSQFDPELAAALLVC